MDNVIRLCACNCENSQLEPTNEQHLHFACTMVVNDCGNGDGAWSAQSKISFIKFGVFLRPGWFHGFAVVAVVNGLTRSSLWFTFFFHIWHSKLIHCCVLCSHILSWKFVYLLWEYWRYFQCYWRNISFFSLILLDGITHKLKNSRIMSLTVSIFRFIYIDHWLNKNPVEFT